MNADGRCPWCELALPGPSGERYLAFMAHLPCVLRPPLQPARRRTEAFHGFNTHRIADFEPSDGPETFTVAANIELIGVVAGTTWITPRQRKLKREQSHQARRRCKAVA